MDQNTVNEPRNTGRRVTVGLPKLVLIGPDGKKYGKYADKDDLAKEADRLWPGQEQADHDKPGWSIQVAGYKPPKIRRAKA